MIAAALAARRRVLHRLYVQSGSARADLEPLLAAARDLGVPVSALEPRELAALARDGDEGSIQGAVLEAGPLPVHRRVDELLAADVVGRAGAALPGRRIVALDGVEDPRNLGAIARVAEAAGATGLVLTDRRSPPLGSVAARASAGALEWLPILSVPNLSRALESLKEAGCWVIAADAGAPRSLFDMPDRLLRGDLVVVLGAEGRGLRPSIRGQADHLVQIPMVGKVESLNVSTAAAVLLFDLVRRAGTDAPATDG